MEPYRGTITEPGLPVVFSVFAGEREGGGGADGDCLMERGSNWRKWVIF